MWVPSCANESRRCLRMSVHKSNSVMLTASLKQCLHVFQQQAQSKAISLNYQAIMILSLDFVAVTSVNLCPVFLSHSFLLSIALWFCCDMFCFVFLFFIGTWALGGECRISLHPVRFLITSDLWWDLSLEIFKMENLLSQITLSPQNQKKIVKIYY